MADSYFEENNKFFGLKGILGRRGFIINTLIIEIIEALLFSTPLMYTFLFNPKTMLDFNVSVTSHGSVPLYFLIWAGIMGIISAALYFPSIVRRVRDIIGEVDENRVYLISSILTVIIFMGYTPVGGTNFFVKWFSFFVILVLIFTKGKITGEKPKSNLIKFNWGAFLGTWIWGLFNKTPITLLMLPLCLTSAWFPFMLICGLKGNEWAYENNQKYSDMDNFHKVQEKQATIWAIFTPFLIVISFIIMTIVSAVAMVQYSKAHPEFIKKLENTAKQYEEVAVKSNFTKIELTDNEYKFYMEPQIWVKLPENSKKSMFRVASNYVATKTGKAYNKSKSKKSFDSVYVPNKVKIYSSFNNELLGEYYLDPKEYEQVYNDIVKGTKGGIKEFYKLLNNGYKFNNHPTLP